VFRLSEIGEVAQGSWIEGYVGGGGKGRNMGDNYKKRLVFAVGVLALNVVATAPAQADYAIG
jgi:hypothetical protein